jgi:TetR/AcrR family transcriptional regulator, transcriptional repressor for nem operon
VPHPSSQKPETRERTLKSARHLFNRRGFAGVTIDEVMAEAGLTRGGFYKHFDTKEELYAEAITQFNCDRPEEGAEAWWGAHVDPSARGPQRAKMIVNAYLSKEHFRDRDGSCPMVGLPSDAARGGEAVRAAYRQVLERMARAFEANLPPCQLSSRERALALVALCVGGMVLARALDDTVVADEVRSAARVHVLAASGWDQIDA